MDYYGRKHSQNFPKIAEEAAAFARDKLSREIKSVPHIKLTKSQLEFILKMLSHFRKKIWIGLMK